VDSTFGVGASQPGVVELKDLDSAFAGDVQSDGSLVVGSIAQRRLVRVDSSGGRDLSFGSGGVVDLNIPNLGLVRDVDVDASDRIVVTMDSGVVRLLFDGQLDPSWHFNLIMDSNHFWALGNSEVDGEGRVLVTGTYKDPSQPMLARLNSSGELDTTFAAGGDVPGRVLLTTFGNRDPVVGADGSTYLVGISGFAFSPR
jgi:hypothetical protein